MIWYRVEWMLLGAFFALSIAIAIGVACGGAPDPKIDDKAGCPPCECPDETATP